MKWVILAVCWAAALICSGTLMAAASGAAQVFATAVMPSLFPVLVLGAVQASGKPARRVCAGTLLLGLCSGSPGGARQVAAQAQQGRLSSRELRFLLGATGTMSPLFFTGAMTSWLGGGGAVMLICHWAGALSVGAVYALWGGRKDGSTTSAMVLEEKRVPLDLRGMLGGAMDALLLVLGAMMLGACMSAVLGKALCRLWPEMPEAAGAILHAALEIGGGAQAVAEALGARAILLLCGLCSLGGASLLMQNLTMLHGLTSWRVLLMLRLSHGAISYGLCRGAMALWPALAGGVQGAITAAGASAGVADESGAGWVVVLMALVLAWIGAMGNEWKVTAKHRACVKRVKASKKSLTGAKQTRKKRVTNSCNRREGV